MTLTQGPGAPSGGAPGPWASRFTAPRLTGPRVVAVAAAVGLSVVWITTGSFVFAVLVLVLIGATAALAALLLGRRDPRSGDTHLPDALPTTDLSPPTPGERVRRALRGLLARPWVRGDGLVRAATARLASEDALVWTPRGQRVAAPHLWLEWNTTDIVEIARRWPLEVLADELVAGYLEHARSTGARRIAARTWLHVLASADVPVGRVVVTAAFSRPQETPLVSTAGPDERPAAALPQTPRPAPTREPGGDPGNAGTPPGPAGRRVPASPTPTVASVTSALGEVMRRRWPPRTTTRTAVLVAETPGVVDVPLTRPTIALGRDPRTDAVVDHPGVSWRHLTLTRRDARTWTVADTGSTNGTLVAGRRIAGLGVLHEGDTLGLGQDGPRFRLVLGPVAAPGPRPTPTRREGRPRQEVA